jgi:hypothetical protein
MKIYYNSWNEGHDTHYDWYCLCCHKNNTSYYYVDSLLQCDICKTTFILLNEKDKSENWNWEIKIIEPTIKHIKDLYK